jgi:hypothetical protein
MKDLEFFTLAAQYGWVVVNLQGMRSQASHPLHGRIVVEWKTSRRRRPAIARVDFWIPQKMDAVGYDSPYIWKAALSTHHGNVREAIEHFLQGRGVATRKAS